MAYYKDIPCASVVPNAPCGVERVGAKQDDLVPLLCVPNAPCGVESGLLQRTQRRPAVFLMHRVELKGSGRFWTFLLLVCS